MRLHLLDPMVIISQRLFPQVKDMSAISDFILDSLTGLSVLKYTETFAQRARHNCNASPGINRNLDLCPFLWTLHGTDAGLLDMLQYAEPSRR